MGQLLDRIDAALPQDESAPASGPLTAKLFADSLRRQQDDTLRTILTPGPERRAAPLPEGGSVELSGESEFDQLRRGDWNTSVPFYADPTEWAIMFGPGAKLASLGMEQGPKIAAKMLGPRIASRGGRALGGFLGGGITGAEYSTLADAAKGENPLPNLPAAFVLGGLLGGTVDGLRPNSSRLSARPATAPGVPVQAAAAGPASSVAHVPAGPPAPAIGSLVPLEPPPTMTRQYPTTGPEVPQGFRLDKMGLGESSVEAAATGVPVSPEMQAVERTLASLGMGTRRVRTFDDMKAAAEELGMAPEVLLRGAAGRPISDAEVVATANLINENAAINVDAMRRLANPSLLTEAERISLEQQARKSQTVIERALQRRIRGGTESGRSVAAYRIIGNRTMDPSYWLTVAQRKLGDQPMTDEIRTSIMAAIQAQDRVALARIVSLLGKAGAADKFAALVRAFMLSNPGTDVRNMVGNLNNAIAHGVADLPATAIDWIASKATGQRTKSLSFRQFGEMARGVRSGFEKAGEVMRYGDTAEQILERWDFNRATHFDNPALELFTQTVFRRLGAEDALFRQPQLFRAIAEMAEVTAKNEGLRGTAFLRRVEELISEPTERMLKVAQESAAYRTFNKESAVASGLQMLERKTGPAGKVVGTFVMPFKRTPINVAETIVDFSPFGIPKTALRWIANRKGDQFLRQRYMAEGLGRAFTGTAIAGLGWHLYQRGMAVGAAPTTQNEKNLRYSLGIPNYSIKVGGKWVGVNNNAPLANILMMGVDAAQRFDDPDKDWFAKLGGSVGAVTGALAEQTFLRGMKQATEAFSDPMRYGGDWLEGVVSAFVPSLVGAVARGTDPYERRIDNPLQAMQSRIPGLRLGLEPQITDRGEPRRQNTGVLGQMFSPVRVSPEKDDLLARAMRSSGYSPGVPQRPEIKVRKGEKAVRLKDSELTRYQQEVGREQTRRMQQRVSARGFFELDPDLQADRLKDAADDAERLVRERWKREYRQRAQ